MPVEQMTTISGIEGIVNQDRVNHINCRKGQVLAFVASRTRWSDLLLYGALGSTFDVYRHCYLRRGYRWDFPTPYVVDPDLALLGYFSGQLPKVELDEVRARLPEYLAGDQPVLFMAPRADFAYWVDFMRRTGTIAAEYRELHSFMVCGISQRGDVVLVVDNTTDNHEFRRFPIPMADIERGYEREPQRWFLQCQTLRRIGEPDLAGFADRYRALVDAHDDGFEIYDLIADGLPGERAEIAETYRTPSVNSLALLAGSRGMFARFLRLTSHGPAVAERYEQIAALATAAQERAGRFHGGSSDVSLDRLRRDLHLLRVREQRALRALRDDLPRGPVTFTSPSGERGD